MEPLALVYQGRRTSSRGKLLYKFGPVDSIDDGLYFAKLTKEVMQIGQVWRVPRDGDDFRFSEAGYMRVWEDKAFVAVWQTLDKAAYARDQATKGRR